MTGRDERDTDEERSRAVALSMRSERELRYQVVDGRVRVTIAGLSRTYRSGEIFIVPAYVAHRLRPVPEGEVPRVLRRCDATVEEEIEWPSDGGAATDGDHG